MNFLAFSKGFAIGIAGVLGLPLLLVLSVSVFLHIENFTRYPTKDPNHVYVSSAAQSGSMNLKKINEGNWQFICLVGPYSDPVKILSEEATRRKVDVEKIDPVETALFGMTPVEETEAAISFVDNAGRGKTILFENFKRVACQHGSVCYGPEIAEVKLRQCRD